MTKHYLAISALLLAPLSADATVYLSGSTPSAGITVSAYRTGQAAGSAFEAATLGNNGSAGFGVYSGIDGYLGNPNDIREPDHAFDNDGRGGSGWSSGVNYSEDFGPDGAVDAALFNFNASVSLNSLRVGYISGDADVSVLAYTGSLISGALPAAANIAGDSFATLLSNGWSFIGNYNMGSVNTSKAINASNVYSSYWLVSAYTSISAGLNKGDTTGLDFGNDYFKLSKIEGTACAGTATGGICGNSGGGGGAGSVPEPTSLLLLAGGMLGWRMNRKTQALAA
ncbi:PEP-CTERM sorting domain-containing protein [Methylomonas sp. EFPC1]|uniref:exosortase-dependent surface protein XDP1 n=1 Tax=Methylomonas sp. EFPC1 TaxID=2812647 RepID=UPI001968940F|nr:exosortase-dependent surface protein XDP1 [Methylomonas sp. EFPC1]QSB02721.1 PEP-CTERM sorting domain-containing protein [Methylomonas sp. EFPC1]